VKQQRAVKRFDGGRIDEVDRLIPYSFNATNAASSGLLAMSCAKS